MFTPDAANTPEQIIPGIINMDLAMDIAFVVGISLITDMISMSSDEYATRP